MSITIYEGRHAIVWAVIVLVEGEVEGVCIVNDDELPDTKQQIEACSDPENPLTIEVHKVESVRDVVAYLGASA